MVLDILREAYKIALEKRKVAAEKAERAKIAKHFNDLYTYRTPWQNKNNEQMTEGSALWGFFPKKGHAWMCPECNKIHISHECSAMSGLQYHRCCSTGEGHRLHHNIRTK